MFPFIIDFSIRTKPCVYLPNAHTIFRYFDHYTNWLIVSAATVSHTYSNPKYCHFSAHRISLSRWIMLSYYRHRKKISFTTSFSSYALKMVVKGFRFTVISLLFYSKITTQNAKAFYKYHVKFFAWNHRLVSAVGNSATHSPCYQQPANEVLGTMTDVCAFIERSNEFARTPIDTIKNSSIPVWEEFSVQSCYPAKFISVFFLAMSGMRCPPCQYIFYIEL